MDQVGPLFGEQFGQPGVVLRLPPRQPKRQRQADETLLRQMIEAHHKWTGSLRAREILDHWADSRARFVKVCPNEYKRALGEIHAKNEAGATIAKAKTSKDVVVPAK